MSESPAQTHTSTHDAPAKSIWPCLAYRDAPGAIRFLTDVLGFRETLVVPGEEREIMHAELRWPEGGGIMLGSTSDESEVGRMKPGSSAVYVVTDDPDAVFDKAGAAGAEIVTALQDKPYGSRDFTLRDPEGVLWTFGTYRGA